MRDRAGSGHRGSADAVGERQRGARVTAPAERASRRSGRRRGGSASGGAASGGAAAAPLLRLLRTELRTEPRRPRTLVTLGVLALVPLLIAIGVTTLGTAGDALSGAPGPGPGPGLIAAVTANGLMLPVAALRIALILLLPLGICIAAADALAGEAAHGTLRGLLLAPVSRPRLVGIKAFGVLMVAVLEVAAVTVVGLLAGVCIVGGGGTMLTLSGTSVGLGSALARVALAACWTLLQIAAVGAVALAVSALTDHPLVVLATVLGGALVFGVLNAIPSLNWLRPVLLTSGWSSLVDLLRDPVPTDGLVHSTLVAAGYLVVGLAVAVAATRRRES
jgi:ABC-2 type transport system permease protein